MYGGKHHKDEDTEQDPNATMLTAGDLTFHDRSVHSPDAYSEDPGEGQATDDMDVSGHMEYYEDAESPSVSGHYSYMDTELQQTTNGVILSSTPTRATRQTFNMRSPFLDEPTLPPSGQHFQRPTRSHSIDNSSINLSLELREQPVADYTSDTLPSLAHQRLSPQPPFASHLQPQLRDGEGDTLPRLRQVSQGEWPLNNPFLARSTRTRLPPLQNTSASGQRKRLRAKRKRGHSWHGRDSVGHVNTASMAAVAE